MLVYGYKRGFCNKGARWENKSVATLFQTEEEGAVVEGIALKMTRAEVTALDPYEGYPEWYNRIDMTLDAFMKDPDNASAALVPTKI